MKAMDKLRKRKAVSPVIATVILVAVAITISVAVAYWMGGISSQYTKFEKVEISSAICEWIGPTNATAGYWKITIQVKNTGTAQCTLKSVFINDIEALYDGVAPPDPGVAICTISSTTGLSLPSGAPGSFFIFIDGPGGTLQYKNLSAGTTVNIKIHSAGGMDYLKLLELV